MRSTLLGGFMLMVRAVKTIVLKVAAISTPTPNAHNSSVPKMRRSCIPGRISAIASPHDATRAEHGDIDQQVAEHEERDGAAGKHARSQRHDAHDPCQRLRVHAD